MVSRRIRPEAVKSQVYAEIHGGPQAAVHDNHVALHKLYGRLERRRGRLLSLQARRGHAMEIYLHKLRLVQHSVDAIAEVAHHLDGVVTGCLSSHASQLAEDHEALQAQSGELHQLENGCMILQHSIAQLEEEIKQKLVMLARALHVTAASMVFPDGNPGHSDSESESGSEIEQDVFRDHVPMHVIEQSSPSGEPRH